MSCPHINAFFSCSFQDEDVEINNYFKTICEALNISSKNVFGGYTETPPEVARKMIEDCKIFLAVIPRREKTSSGKWTMPSAVHEEMAMAFALKKPTLLLIEDCVNCDGFIPNLGTHIKFDRSTLRSDEFIKKVVSSIHDLRIKAVEQHNLLPDQDAAGFYAEHVGFLIELIEKNSKPIWHYHTTRKLVFMRNFEGQIKNSVWATYVPENATEKIAHTLTCSANRSDIKPVIQIIKDTPQQLEVGMDFEGNPQKDDWVKIDFSSSSPYFNPIEKTGISIQERPYINGKTFDCFDGMIPIQPTRELRVQFRFPDWYPIEKNSTFPFVGSYSGGIDYILESEIKRCQIETNKFGGATQIDIKIESPLMRHVYGVAWNIT